MKPESLLILASAFALFSCGSPDDDQTGSASAPPSASAATSAGKYDRKTLELCPALEAYRDELAAIVGFQQNPERGLSMSAKSSQCFIRGKGGDYIGVERLPAMVKSVEPYASESFDATTSPASEVGDDAMFVDHGSQPHVIFSMGPMLLDVNAEHYKKTPDRDTMVALANRVRDILKEAN